MEQPIFLTNFLSDLSYLGYLLQYSSYQLPAQRDTRFRRSFNGCQGYLKLDMVEEAWDELQGIAPVHQLRPEVMQLRVWVLMKKRAWASALEIAEILCRQMPDMAVPYLDAAYCLHELQKTEDARKKLLNGPMELHEYPTYHYNLACYEASLGHVEVARHYLETAINMNPKYRYDAKSDPDLKCLVQS